MSRSSSSNATNQNSVQPSTRQSERENQTSCSLPSTRQSTRDNDHQPTVVQIQTTSLSVETESAALTNQHLANEEMTIAADPRGATQIETEIPVYNIREPPPPYPGFARTLSGHLREERTAVSSNLYTCRTRQHTLGHVPISTVDMCQIPSIPSISEHQNQQYESYMNWSLCLLVVCLCFCNVPSILFTVPAVICSWKSMQAAMRHQYRTAGRRKTIATICNCIAIIEFCIVVIIAIFSSAIYFLMSSNILILNFN